MVWPFSDKATLSDVLEQLVRTTDELQKISRQLQQQAQILVVIAKREIQPAADLARIRRLLWRLVVQPSEFRVLTRGESMGFMNKSLVLGPVTEDTIKQVVMIESPGKVSIVKELDAAEGQSVDFSVPAGTEVTISLQYFDEVDNGSSVMRRTFTVVDDVAPDGPATLNDIQSISETDAPAFQTLDDVPAPPVDIPVRPDPVVEEPVVEEPVVEEPVVEEPVVEEPVVEDTTDEDTTPLE